MPIALLAALPAIFQAVDKVADLFTAGKQAVEQITGQPSQASTPSQLQAEIEALPSDQQQRWAEIMQTRIEQYRAETDRLANEQGEVDAATLSILPPDIAAKVAVLRMTTRPWAVRMSIHFLLTPAYAMWVDGLVLILQNLFRLIDSIVGTSISWQPRLLADHFIDHSVYQAIYEAGVPWLTSMVLGYMTLRSVVDKPPGNQGIGGALDGAVSAIGKALGSFRKK